ncbi:hypothetical protein BC828DRAFT_406427 [Blastocladiella britannica]|nr:hypothetical protein BC828DRAFT_406427 [Blastocladiella britannica]
MPSVVAAHQPSALGLTPRPASSSPSTSSSTAYSSPSASAAATKTGSKTTSSTTTMARPQIPAESAPTANSTSSSSPTKKPRNKTTKPVVATTTLAVHTRLLLTLARAFFTVATPLFFAALALFNKTVAVLKPLPSYPLTKPIVAPVLDWLQDIATDYRGLFVTVIVNPICLVWDAVDYVQDWMLDCEMPAVGDVAVRRAIHHDRVVHVQNQVRIHVANGATRLCTARPGFLVMSVRAPIYKSQWAGVDVGALRDVIEVDEEREVVLVEPGCNMGRLSRELIQRGWTIQVLPELDELTVGGLINGFGIETSSHKYGLFQHTCTAFDIVLASGELVHCTSESHPELFAAIPWSHGTIGFVVAAEIKLVRALPYVRLEYTPCTSTREASRVFETASRNNDHDFVESLMYSRETAVVMTGKMAPTVPKDQKLNVISRWYKPWFFTHVQSFLGKSSPSGTFVEYIPLRDYYHRHTRSIFWTIRDIVPFGNQAWYRWLFAWAGPPKIALLKLTTTGKLHHLWVTKQVVQDLLVPITTLDASLDFFQRELDTYPLWLCPMRMLSPAEDLLALRQFTSPVLKQAQAEHGHQSHAFQPPTTPRGSFTPPHPSEQLYVDIGAYGVPKAPSFHHETTLARIEEFVRDVQGYSACYADIVASPVQFRVMFDHRTYDEVREKYDAKKYFPQVQEKVHKSARA